MKKFAVVLFAAALAACNSQTENAGQPATDTTPTTETTATAYDTAATTTGSTGGTLSNMSPEDKEFVIKAGQGGLAEVQMGNLALEKASHADVKAFAQRMVTDHGTANTELQQLAINKGLSLPTELDAHHKSGLDHLNGLSATEFDKAYMQHMVDDHTKTVADFEKASQSASDSDVKGWAAKTLPTLQDHLRQAKEVSSKLK
ncbi:MAG TPA: DUF4142 domain-containing protein [Thermoanaerobaculia bacterium]|jgi:putative membrane protein